MMSPGVVLVSLLSLVLVYSAAGLECRIYVSSSNGINNTSCWTGGVQTPCATIDLAIQGTATLQYNCSSGILINLSPGTYTLDTTSLLEQQLLKNNVSIIGMRDGSRYEEVSITCLHVSSSSYNWSQYIVFHCVSLYNCNNVPVTCTEPFFGITTHNQPVLGNEACPSFKLDLELYEYLPCFIDNINVDGNCSCDYFSFVAFITDTSTNKRFDWTYNDLEVCMSIGQQGCQYYLSFYDYDDEVYEVKKCLDDYFNADGKLEITVYARTFFYVNMSANATGTVSVNCMDSYFANGKCTDTTLVMPCDNVYDIPCNSYINDCDTYCEDGFDYFTPFVINYPLCISTDTTPLGVLSFWYVIGFYPLLLLLLLYVWITLYDKGYKCVVFITRPFYCCMACFWRITDIEPSFTHSIASIYILCFTQLTIISFKILSFSQTATSNSSDIKFYYDMKQDYFKGVHGAAGFFAILVLLFLILLPTLYILLYPFEWFHKLLDCLHLRKQLLISLGDVFTGPYKDGTEDTYDYRFMAGLYLLARIIISSQFIYGYYSTISILISQACCSFLLAVLVIILRPFQRNIHNFTEVLLIIAFPAIEGATSVFPLSILALFVFNFLIFGIIIPCYIVCKVIGACCDCCCDCCCNYTSEVARYQEAPRQPLARNNDDWVANRMENPQESDEHYVPGLINELYSEDHQPITIDTATTYGSIL
uniref:TRP C-terminal domain-containing protein n=1 Tax=Amphimedon queenslandica TaxID=400682 RepID=A0A1X7VTJ3_AMPQE